MMYGQSGHAVNRLTHGGDPRHRHRRRPAFRLSLCVDIEWLVRRSFLVREIMAGKGAPITVGGEGSGRTMKLVQIEKGNFELI